MFKIKEFGSRPRCAVRELRGVHLVVTNYVCDDLWVFDISVTR
jgi:hypothetical protein